MTEKKIATAVEVLVKVANFESIRITKYGESKIDYDSPEDMLKKEDQLNDEVIADIVRSMKRLPEQFPNYANSILTMGDRIGKKIPEWLENNAEPNIANVAKKDYEKSDAKAHAEKESKEQKIEEENEEVNDLIEENEDKNEENAEKPVQTVEKEAIIPNDEDDDLFAN